MLERKGPLDGRAVTHIRIRRARSAENRRTLHLRLEDQQNCSDIFPAALLGGDIRRRIDESIQKVETGSIRVAVIGRSQFSP